MISTVLNIEGMMCPMCEAQGIKCKRVKSSHKKGTTEILTEVAPDVAAITESVEKTGYKVTGSTSGEKKRAAFFFK